MSTAPDTRASGPTGSQAGWHTKAAAGVPRIAAVAAAIAAAMVAVWVLGGDLKPDVAIVGTLIGLAALVLFVLALTSTERLTELVGRVKSVTIGTFSLQLHDSYAKFAAEQAAASAQDDDPTNAQTLYDLKISLENKLTYLANNILNADKGSDPMPRPLTIGSLEKGDGLIDDEQARIAYDILGMRPTEYQALSAADRQVFLSGASAFVDLLRINVFANLIEKRLQEHRWFVSRQSDDARDLLVSRQEHDPTKHHIIPAIARKETAFVYSRAKTRLEMASLATGEAGRRFIVVPPTFLQKQDAQLLAANSGDQTADDVWSVTLYALLRWLDEVSH